MAHLPLPPPSHQAAVAEQQRSFDGQVRALLELGQQVGATVLSSWALIGHFEQSIVWARDWDHVCFEVVGQALCTDERMRICPACPSKPCSRSRASLRS